MSLLEGVEVRWAQVLAPDTQFEPVWSLLAILKEHHKEQLSKESKPIDPKGKGIKFKPDDEGNTTLRFKRKVEKADGSGQNKPPLVCGPGGPSDVFTQLIGNGSICNIQYRLVAYNNKFGTGVVTDLQGVQVIEHVPYGVPDGGEFKPVAKTEINADGEDDTPFTESKPSSKPAASNEYDDEDFS